MPRQAVIAPLQGLRVVDLAPGALGAIGRTLAELGADVVRIESPDGADRTRGPAIAGVGLTFAAANLGKRSVRLDLADAADRRTFEALVAHADILIEATRPGSAEAVALDAGALRARYPALVILSVSDFGAGAYAGWQATDLVLHALSGELSRSGVPGRAPLPPPGELAVQCAAAQGVYVVLLAYLHRLQTGGGDRLDLSLLDAATQALDPGYGIAGSATSGVPASQLPRGRPEARSQYPIIPCKDGFVRLCVLAPRQWRGLFEWMGRPAEFADPAFNNNQHRFASPTLLPRVADFFADKTRAEIEAEGQSHRVPTAALLTLDEALASEQIRAREVFTTVEIAPGVRAPFPNAAFEIDGGRAGAGALPPPAGDDAGDIARAWAEPRPTVDAAGRFGEPGRPLAGLRVLDLGVIVVGAEQGRLLADYGAEVIKVENAAFMDGSRASSPGGMAPPFAAGHRNKRGLALNLRDPEGRALFLKLAEQADVVLSNFKPGTLESLDLGPQTLLAHNPRLIVADSSAFGASGPWSERMGYGPLVRASAGLTSQWRYPGEPNSFSDAITVYPDHVAARVGVSCVLALLIRRLRTGRGGTVSTAQNEIMLSQMAAEIAGRSLIAQGRTLDGEPSHDAPWGVFPCAGDDEWCVVSVRGDADWRALCGALGRPDLGQDAALSTAAGRVAERARIDEAVGAWLQDLSPHEAMARLQAAGAPAAAMLRVSELPDFAYFQERGLFQPLAQPQIEDRFMVDNAPVRSERLADPPLAPAPLMGEHTVEIARRLLGLADGEIERLLAAGVLDTPTTIAQAKHKGHS
jgi:crotonobetainyl-CoA:carnitine CoA-transferase CaiB-like acyl-CoA transferase